MECWRRDRSDIRIKIQRSDLPKGWSIEKLKEVVDILDSQRVPVSAKNGKTGRVTFHTMAQQSKSAGLTITFLTKR